MEAATARLAGTGTRNPRGAVLRLRSDTFLVDLWALGDDAAFAEIYRRHEARVFSICLGVLGSPHDAQDAMQEVWSSLATSMRESPPRELRPWLGRVARNAAIDIHRRRRVEPAGDAVDYLVAPEHTGVDRERLAELVAGLKELPERQRSALVMRELGGYTYPEIAAALEVEEDAVTGLVARARISLRNSAESHELSCSSVRQRLAEELDGRQRPGELRRHLRSCSGCREFHTAMKDDVKVLRSLTPAAAGMGGLGLFAISRVPKTAIGAGILTKAGVGTTGAKLAAFCVAGVCATAGVEEAVRHDVIPAGKKEASAAPSDGSSGEASGGNVVAAAAAAATPGIFRPVTDAAKAIPGADPNPERTAVRERVTGDEDGRPGRRERAGGGEGGRRGSPGEGERPRPNSRRDSFPGPGPIGRREDQANSFGGPRPQRDGNPGGGQGQGGRQGQRRQGGSGQDGGGQGRPDQGGGNRGPGGGQRRQEPAQGPTGQQPTQPAEPQQPAQQPQQQPAEDQQPSGSEGSEPAVPDLPLVP